MNRSSPPKNVPRAVISGGTGFVGPHLANQLESEGVEVTCFSVETGSPSSSAKRFRSFDVRDTASVNTLLEEVNPDHIYHLAAITSIAAAAQDERLAYEVNVWGTRNVFFCASQVSKSVRVLNVSSSQVYSDDASMPIKEDAPIRPQNTYAVTKAMAELHSFQYLKKMDVITLRPFNHSGPGQSENFVLSRLAHEIAAAEAGFIEPIVRVGNLNVSRDFTDVRDVVRAYGLLATKGQSGEVYNICSGRALKLSDALDFLISQSSAGIKVEIDPARLREGEAKIVVGDPSKLISDTGWRPQISVEQMLLDLLGYWRSASRNQPPLKARRSDS